MHWQTPRLGLIYTVRKPTNAMEKNCEFEITSISLIYNDCEVVLDDILRKFIQYMRIIKARKKMIKSSLISKYFV